MHFPALSRKQYFASHLTPSGPSSEDACPICREAWNADTEAIVYTICSKHHVFHKDCITGWLTYGNTCPACRSVCFPEDKPTIPSFQPQARTYGIVDGVYSANLAAQEVHFVSNMYDTSVNQISGMITPLMDSDEIFEQFGIDIENTTEDHEFTQAMSLVVSAGVALCCFPPNQEIDWMPQLVYHLQDWKTIHFAVATFFIQMYEPLMKPRQWVMMLAERNKIYQQALASDDFGLDTKEWLDHINLSSHVRCQIELSDFKSYGELAHIDCVELRVDGTPVAHHCHLVPMTLPANLYWDFTDSYEIPRPVVYLEDDALWVAERAVGGITHLLIDYEAGVVTLHTSADQVMQVYLGFASEAGLKLGCGVPALKAYTP
jgi:hypothetical protein